MYDLLVVYRSAVTSGKRIAVVYDLTAIIADIAFADNNIVLDFWLSEFQCITATDLCLTCHLPKEGIGRLG